MKKSLFFILLIPIFLVGITLLLVVSQKNSSDLREFPVEIFEKNPDTLRGNSYSIKCIIDCQLAQNEAGRILAVKLWNDSGRTSIYVPPSIDQNFEIGQRYEMSVRVKENMLFVEALEKF